MSLFDTLVHLLNFLAPAGAVALLLVPALCWRAPALRGRCARVGLWLWLAGALVLFAGLVYFGRDGKMATYAALVLVQGGLAAWWRAR